MYTVIGVNQLMAEVQRHEEVLDGEPQLIPNDRQYTIYLDKGYANDTHIFAAHHGVFVTPAQEHDNWIMSRLRVEVEWGFGKVYTRCPFLKRPSIFKLRGVDVAKYLRVATLLTNAHTCLRQSQAGLYFDCVAPTLQSYFA